VRSTPKSHENQTRFSHIEWLVVMAISGIIAATLLPGEQGQGDVPFD